MRVLRVAEQQAAAVRVDGREVDAVRAQQRQQQVGADAAEVAAYDAVEVGRLRAEVVQQGGDGVIGSGGKRCFSTIIFL